MDRAAAGRLIALRAGEGFCALPVTSVSETMRPLPCAPARGAPDFVLGVSIVRGRPVPVVDLARLLGSGASAATRYVLVRVGDRAVALAVSEVAGFLDLELERLEELPPLLAGAPALAIDALGSLDGELLVLLEAGRIVPESVWAACEERS